MGEFNFMVQIGMKGDELLRVGCALILSLSSPSAAAHHDGQCENNGPQLAVACFDGGANFEIISAW